MGAAAGGLVYGHGDNYPRCPVHTLKLCPIGTSTGTTLPKELPGKLRVAAGDTLYVTEAPDGGFRLTPYNPVFAEQMQAAEQIMRDDRDVLHALAQ